MRLRVPLVDEGHGRLLIGGSRYLLIRPETLAALQRAVEAALGPRAAECFVAGGRAGGARVAQGLQGSPRERALRVMEMGTAIGWGAFALERLDAAELVVRVSHSPFAEAYGAAPGPVCHLTRGVLEAVAAALLERPLPVVETACVAAGAQACRFATVAAGGAR
ncbi:MAG: 4-vinyl reductase [Armatimonadota bacterium]|nr:4-vinyl reductase [Armatimonadota bacterium]